jgi:hypothetical protein
VAVAFSGAYAEVCRLVGMRGRRIGVEVIIGAGSAISHFKITRAAFPEGNHVILGTDASFNADAKDWSASTPTNAYQTAASGVFQIVLDGKAAEYAFFVQAATAITTCQVRGTGYPQDE